MVRRRICGPPPALVCPPVTSGRASLETFAPFLRLFRRQKPGAGIGWTEPRNEKAIGFMDIRKTLKGYIGGVKIRESLFAEV